MPARPCSASCTQCVPNAHELLLRTRDPATGREVQPAGPAAEACPRRGFVAAPGCVLLSADYKQAELRLMAHFRWGQATATEDAEGAAACMEMRNRAVGQKAGAWSPMLAGADLPAVAHPALLHTLPPS